MLRGAKKKKGPDGPAEAESSDIINIFKDKTDPVPYSPMKSPENE